MSIATEIERLQNAKASIKASIENKGVTVGDGTLDTYASKIDEISSGGVEIPEITKCAYLFQQRGELVDVLFPYCNNITMVNNMFESANYKGYINFEGKVLKNIANGQNMFSGCSATKINIKGIDFSLVTSLSNFMNQCVYVTELISDDIINCSKASSLSNAFYNCELLPKLPTIDCSSVTSVGSYTFYNLEALVDFGGLKDIGKAYRTTQSANYSSYKIDLSDSYNLSHESLMNVINNLYDIATKGCNAQQLILSSSRLALLTEEEIAIATNKGWNVTT